MLKLVLLRSVMNEYCHSFIALRNGAASIAGAQFVGPQRLP